MDDAHSIKLEVALYYVNAWRQLYITYLARIQPDAPVAVILSGAEIDVLEAIGKSPVTTISSAIIAIANSVVMSITKTVHHPVLNGCGSDYDALKTWLQGGNSQDKICRHRRQ